MRLKANLVCAVSEVFRDVSPPSERSGVHHCGKQIRESSCEEFLTPDLLDAGKSTVEVCCCANQREMSEGLWEITEMPPVGAYLF
jgi:hypothetical protein